MQAGNSSTIRLKSHRRPICGRPSESPLKASTRCRVRQPHGVGVAHHRGLVTHRRLHPNAPGRTHRPVQAAVERLDCPPRPFGVPGFLFQHSIDPRREILHFSRSWPHVTDDAHVIRTRLVERLVVVALIAPQTRQRRRATGDGPQTPDAWRATARCMGPPQVQARRHNQSAHLRRKDPEVPRPIEGFI